jgi:hypothetical protein
MGWLRKQYEDIRGHFKWALLGTLWLVISWAVNHLLRMIPSIPEWLIYILILLASFVVFALLAKRGDSPQVNTSQVPTNALVSPPQAPNFNAAEFIKTAYLSPLEQEAEDNIRIAATQTQPNDREGFYVKIIGIGAMQYAYDIAWAYIFRSQLLLLSELNTKILLIAQVKLFYDKAAAENPIPYANYSFDQWMTFIKTHGLLLHHPNGMVEITVRGRDFLKYLIHWGRSPDQRRFRSGFGITMTN